MKTKIRVAKNHLKLLLLFLISFLVVQTSDAQYVREIESISGSLAPFGITQYMSIDSAGYGVFYRQNLDSAAVDSTFFILTSLQLQTILDTANAVSFFGLDTLYVQTADSLIVLDGSGITLRIAEPVNENIVQVMNYVVPEVDRIVNTINSFLIVYGIQIQY